MNGGDGSFLTALEWFWNSWASARKDILLICCSSATSWIVNQVFHNHGGLYGRVNRRIHLHPFTLQECELFLEQTGLPNAGSTTRILEELEQSDFIRRYVAFGQKKRDELYQLTDAYTLFYYHFLKDGKNNDAMFWEHHLGSSKLLSWTGYAFEQVCLAHSEQIKQAMGISGIAVSQSGWMSKSKDNKAQIDLVLDRADNVVNLCEIKFSSRPYAIDKQYAERMQSRQWQFEEETKTRKSCQLVMITTYGLQSNQYVGMIQNSLTMDDLFR